MKRCLQHHHSKPRNKDVKGHSFSSKPSKHKYDTRCETKSKEHDQSAHKRHKHSCRAQNSEGALIHWLTATKSLSSIATRSQLNLSRQRRFQEALGYRTFCQADKWSHYEYEVARSVAKSVKPLKLHMRSQIFDSFAPVSILSILSAFKMSCNMYGVDPGAALWLVLFIMRRPTPLGLVHESH